MPLTLTVRTPSSIPLEVDSVRLEIVRSQSLADVARTLVWRGNRQVELGEFFDIAGSAQDDEALVWRGDCSRVKLIGTHLASGSIRVEGDAGMHLGAEMKGGDILVEGNAGDWVGAEMHGGKIRVQGNAGHLIGAVYRGGRKGMTEGEILIHGNAGNEVGVCMRRGLIAIGGRAGDAAGAGMIAGTIFVFGEAGIRNGAGMKRGTIGLFGTEVVPEILPTFRYACTYRPTFLRVYLRYLQQRDFPVPAECLNGAYQRFCGDLLELGKGEIFTRVA